MNKFKIDYKNKITSGFTYPEDYFEQFSEALNSKINQPKATVKVISINTKKWITIVAAVFIIALSVSVYSKMVVSQSYEKNTTEYYITNHSEISQYDLITLLDKKDIENLSVELNSSTTKMDNEFTNINDIENYLTE
ncbi:MAG: hypothetical protein K9I35_05300 [Flavobacterium sp.]|jgi:predicted histidine transporter YuiF (NhaC family)|nr:hypothetical protein [Flavobacterium sp.]